MLVVVGWSSYVASKEEGSFRVDNSDKKENGILNYLENYRSEEADVSGINLLRHNILVLFIRFSFDRFFFLLSTLLSLSLLFLPCFRSLSHLHTHHNFHTLTLIYILTLILTQSFSHSHKFKHTNPHTRLHTLKHTRTQAY